MRIEGTVIRCPALAPDVSHAHHTGVLWQAAPGRLLLDVPGVARYLVRDGTQVDIEPSPGAPEEEVRRFLGMTPAAALYLQRGILVLHAAVVVSAAGSAVVLAGESGSGKSVLLETLVRRGWGVLAGDLAPVKLDGNHVLVAIPTWPEVTADEPLPIRALWWLGLHNAASVEVTDVTGMARFEAVVAMTYQRLITSALLDRASYLRTAGALARADIPFRRLIRPRARWSADELADIVESASTG